MGRKVITTIVVVLIIHPLASVTVTVYVPEAAVDTFVIVGFCNAEANEFGPDQLYVKAPVPPEAVAERVNVLPEQTGVFDVILVILIAAGCVIFNAAFSVITQVGVA